MQAFKRKLSLHRTSKRLKKVWQEYAQVVAAAGGGGAGGAGGALSSSERAKKLSAFIESLMDADPELPAVVERLTDDFTEVISALLDVAEMGAAIRKSLADGSPGAPTAVERKGSATTAGGGVTGAASAGIRAVTAGVGSAVDVASVGPASLRDVEGVGSGTGAASAGAAQVQADALRSSVSLPAATEATAAATAGMMEDLESAEGVAAIAEIVHKALHVAELCLREEKYREKVMEIPNIVSRVLNVLEAVEDAEDTQVTVQILNHLATNLESSVEIGRQEGFKKLVRLILRQDPTLSSQILATMSRFLDLTAKASSGAVSPNPGAGSDQRQSLQRERQQSASSSRGTAVAGAAASIKPSSSSSSLASKSYEIAMTAVNEILRVGPRIADALSSLGVTSSAGPRTLDDDRRGAVADNPYRVFEAVHATALPLIVLDDAVLRAADAIAGRDLQQQKLPKSSSTTLSDRPDRPAHASSHDVGLAWDEDGTSSHDGSLLQELLSTAPKMAPLSTAARGRTTSEEADAEEAAHDDDIEAPRTPPPQTTSNRGSQEQKQQQPHQPPLPPQPRQLSMDQILQELLCAQGAVLGVVSVLSQAVSQVQGLQALQTLRGLLMRNLRAQEDFLRQDGYSKLIAVFDRLSLIDTDVEEIKEDEEQQQPQQQQRQRQRRVATEAFVGQVFQLLNTIVLDGEVTRDALISNVDAFRMVFRIVEESGSVQIVVAALQSIETYLCANPENAAFIEAVHGVQRLAHLFSAELFEDSSESPDLPIGAAAAPSPPPPTSSSFTSPNRVPTTARAARYQWTRMDRMAYLLHLDRVLRHMAVITSYRDTDIISWYALLLTKVALHSPTDPCNNVHEVLAQPFAPRSGMDDDTQPHSAAGPLTPRSVHEEEADAHNHDDAGDDARKERHTAARAQDGSGSIPVDGDDASHAQCGNNRSRTSPPRLHGHAARPDGLRANKAWHARRCMNCEVEDAVVQSLHVTAKRSMGHSTPPSVPDYPGSHSSTSPIVLCWDCDRVLHKAPAKRRHIRIPLASAASAWLELLAVDPDAPNEYVHFHDAAYVELAATLGNVRDAHTPSSEQVRSGVYRRPHLRQRGMANDSETSMMGYRVLCTYLSINRDRPIQAAVFVMLRTIRDLIADRRARGLTTSCTDVLILPLLRVLVAQVTTGASGAPHAALVHLADHAESKRADSKDDNGANSEVTPSSSAASTVPQAKHTDGSCLLAPQSSCASKDLLDWACTLATESTGCGDRLFAGLGAAVGVASSVWRMDRITLSLALQALMQVMLRNPLMPTQLHSLSGDSRSLQPVGDGDFMLPPAPARFFLFSGYPILFRLIAGDDADNAQDIAGAELSHDLNSVSTLAFLRGPAAFTGDNNGATTTPRTTVAAATTTSTAVGHGGHHTDATAWEHPEPGMHGHARRAPLNAAKRRTGAALGPIGVAGMASSAGAASPISAGAGAPDSSAECLLPVSSADRHLACWLAREVLVNVCAVTESTFTVATSSVLQQHRFRQQSLRGAGECSDGANATRDGRDMKQDLRDGKTASQRRNGDSSGAQPDAAVPGAAGSFSDATAFDHSACSLFADHDEDAQYPAVTFKAAMHTASAWFTWALAGEVPALSVGGITSNGSSGELVLPARLTDALRAVQTSAIGAHSAPPLSAAAPVLSSEHTTTPSTARQNGNVSDAADGDAADASGRNNRPQASSPRRRTRGRRSSTAGRFASKASAAHQSPSTGQQTRPHTAVPAVLEEVDPIATFAWLTHHQRNTTSRSYSQRESVGDGPDALGQPPDGPAVLNWARRLLVMQECRALMGATRSTASDRLCLNRYVSRGANPHSDGAEGDGNVPSMLNATSMGTHSFQHSFTDGTESPVTAAAAAALATGQAPSAFGVDNGAGGLGTHFSVGTSADRGEAVPATVLFTLAVQPRLGLHMATTGPRPTDADNAPAAVETARLAKEAANSAAIPEMDTAGAALAILAASSNNASADRLSGASVSASKAGTSSRGVGGNPSARAERESGACGRSSAPSSASAASSSAGSRHGRSNESGSAKRAPCAQPPLALPLFRAAGSDWGLRENLVESGLVRALLHRLVHLELLLPSAQRSVELTRRASAKPRTRGQQIEPEHEKAGDDIASVIETSLRTLEFVTAALKAERDACLSSLACIVVDNVAAKQEVDGCISPIRLLSLFTTLYPSLPDIVTLLLAELGVTGAALLPPFRPFTTVLPFTLSVDATMELACPAAAMSDTEAQAEGGYSSGLNFEVALAEKEKQAAAEGLERNVTWSSWVDSAEVGRDVLMPGNTYLLPCCAALPVLHALCPSVMPLWSDAEVMQQHMLFEYAPLFRGSSLQEVPLEPEAAHRARRTPVPSVGSAGSGLTSNALHQLPTLVPLPSGPASALGVGGTGGVHSRPGRTASFSSMSSMSSSTAASAIGDSALARSGNPSAEATGFGGDAVSAVVTTRTAATAHSKPSSESLNGLPASSTMGTVRSISYDANQVAAGQPHHAPSQSAHSISSLIGLGATSASASVEGSDMCTDDGGPGLGILPTTQPQSPQPPQPPQPPQSSQYTASASAVAREMPVPVMVAELHLPNPFADDADMGCAVRAALLAHTAATSEVLSHTYSIGLQPHLSMLDDRDRSQSFSSASSASSITDSSALAASASTAALVSSATFAASRLHPHSQSHSHLPPQAGAAAGSGKNSSNRSNSSNNNNYNNNYCNDKPSVISASSAASVSTSSLRGQKASRHGETARRRSRVRAAMDHFAAVRPPRQSTMVASNLLAADAAAPSRYATALDMLVRDGSFALQTLARLHKPQFAQMRVRSAQYASVWISMVIMANHTQSRPELMTLLSRFLDSSVISACMLWHSRLPLLTLALSSMVSDLAKFQVMLLAAKLLSFGFSFERLADLVRLACHVTQAGCANSELHSTLLTSLQLTDAQRATTASRAMTSRDENQRLLLYVIGHLTEQEYVPFYFHMSGDDCFRNNVRASGIDKLPSVRNGVVINCWVRIADDASALVMPLLHIATKKRTRYIATPSLAETRHRDTGVRSAVGANAGSNSAQSTGTPQQKQQEANMQAQQHKGNNAADDGVRTACQCFFKDTRLCPALQQSPPPIQGRLSSSTAGTNDWWSASDPFAARSRHERHRPSYALCLSFSSHDPSTMGSAAVATAAASMPSLPPSLRQGRATSAPTLNLGEGTAGTASGAGSGIGAGAGGVDLAGAKLDHSSAAAGSRSAMKQRTQQQQVRAGGIAGGAGHGDFDSDARMASVDTLPDPDIAAHIIAFADSEATGVCEEAEDVLLRELLLSSAAVRARFHAWGAAECAGSSRSGGEVAIGADEEKGNSNIPRPGVDTLQRLMQQLSTALSVEEEALGAVFAVPDIVVAYPWAPDTGYHLVTIELQQPSAVRVFVDGVEQELVQGTLPTQQLAEMRQQQLYAHLDSLSAAAGGAGGNSSSSSSSSNSKSTTTTNSNNNHNNNREGRSLSSSRLQQYQHQLHLHHPHPHYPRQSHRSHHHHYHPPRRTSSHRSQHGVHDAVGFGSPAGDNGPGGGGSSRSHSRRHRARGSGADVESPLFAGVRRHPRAPTLLSAVRVSPEQLETMVARFPVCDKQDSADVVLGGMVGSILQHFHSVPVILSSATDSLGLGIPGTVSSGTAATAHPTQATVGTFLHQEASSYGSTMPAPPIGVSHGVRGATYGLHSSGRMPTRKRVRLFSRCVTALCGRVATCTIHEGSIDHAALVEYVRCGPQQMWPGEGWRSAGTSTSASAAPSAPGGSVVANAPAAALASSSSSSSSSSGSAAVSSFSASQDLVGPADGTKSTLSGVTAGNDGGSKAGKGAEHSGTTTGSSSLSATPAGVGVASPSSSTGVGVLSGTGGPGVGGTAAGSSSATSGATAAGTTGTGTSVAGGGVGAASTGVAPAPTASALPVDVSGTDLAASGALVKAETFFPDLKPIVSLQPTDFPAEHQSNTSTGTPASTRAGGGFASASSSSRTAQAPQRSSSYLMADLLMIFGGARDEDKPASKLRMRGSVKLFAPPTLRRAEDRVRASMLLLPFVRVGHAQQTGALRIIGSLLNTRELVDQFVRAGGAELLSYFFTRSPKCLSSESFELLFDTMSPPVPFHIATSMLNEQERNRAKASGSGGGYHMVDILPREEPDVPVQHPLLSRVLTDLLLASEMPSLVFEQVTRRLWNRLVERPRLCSTWLEENGPVPLVMLLIKASIDAQRARVVAIPPLDRIGLGVPHIALCLASVIEISRLASYKANFSGGVHSVTANKDAGGSATYSSREGGGAAASAGGVGVGAGGRSGALDNNASVATSLALLQSVLAPSNPTLRAAQQMNVGHGADGGANDKHADCTAAHADLLSSSGSGDGGGGDSISGGGGKRAHRRESKAQAVAKHGLRDVPPSARFHLTSAALRIPCVMILRAFVDALCSVDSAGFLLPMIRSALPGNGPWYLALNLAKCEWPEVRALAVRLIGVLLLTDRWAHTNSAKQIAGFAKIGGFTVLGDILSRSVPTDAIVEEVLSILYGQTCATTRRRALSGTTSNGSLRADAGNSKPPAEPKPEGPRSHSAGGISDAESGDGVDDGLPGDGEDALEKLDDGNVAGGAGGPPDVYEGLDSGAETDDATTDTDVEHAVRSGGDRRRLRRQRWQQPSAQRTATALLPSVEGDALVTQDADTPEAGEEGAAAVHDSNVAACGSDVDRDIHTAKTPAAHTVQSGAPPSPVSSSLRGASPEHGSPSSRWRAGSDDALSADERVPGYDMLSDRSDDEEDGRRQLEGRERHHLSLQDAGRRRVSALATGGTGVAAGGSSALSGDESDGGRRARRPNWRTAIGAARPIPRQQIVIPQMLPVLMCSLRQAASPELVRFALNTVEESVTSTGARPISSGGGRLRSSSSDPNLSHTASTAATLEAMRRVPEENVERIMAQQQWLRSIVDTYDMFHDRFAPLGHRQHRDKRSRSSSSESTGRKREETKDAGDGGGIGGTATASPGESTKSTGERDSAHSSAGARATEEMLELGGGVGGPQLDTEAQEAILDQYCDPLLNLVQRLVLYDMRFAPRGPRHFVDVVKLSDAQEFQVTVMSDVLDAFQLAPVLSADHAQNTLRNLSTLLVNAHDRMEMTLDLYVHSIGVINLINYRNPPDVRSLLCDTDLLEMRNTFVLRILQWRPSELERRALAPEEEQGPRQGADRLSNDNTAANASPGNRSSAGGAGGGGSISTALAVTMHDDDDGAGIVAGDDSAADTTDIRQDDGHGVDAEASFSAAMSPEHAQLYAKVAAITHVSSAFENLVSASHKDQQQQITLSLLDLFVQCTEVGEAEGQLALARMLQQSMQISRECRRVSAKVLRGNVLAQYLMLVTDDAHVVVSQDKLRDVAEQQRAQQQAAAAAPTTSWWASLMGYGSSTPADSGGSSGTTLAATSVSSASVGVGGATDNVTDTTAHANDVDDLEIGGASAMEQRESLSSMHSGNEENLVQSMWEFILWYNEPEQEDIRADAQERVALHLAQPMRAVERAVEKLGQRRGKHHRNATEKVMRAMAAEKRVCAEIGSKCSALQSKLSTQFVDALRASVEARKERIARGAEVYDEFIALLHSMHATGLSRVDSASGDESGGRIRGSSDEAAASASSSLGVGAGDGLGVGVGVGVGAGGGGALADAESGCGDRSTNAGNIGRARVAGRLTGAASSAVPGGTAASTGSAASGRKAEAVSLTTLSSTETAEAQMIMQLTEDPISRGLEDVRGMSMSARQAWADVKMREFSLLHAPTPSTPLSLHRGAAAGVGSGPVALGGPTAVGAGGLVCAANGVTVDVASSLEQLALYGVFPAAPVPATTTGSGGDKPRSHARSNSRGSTGGSCDGDAPWSTVETRVLGHQVLWAVSSFLEQTGMRAREGSE